jgi:non-specific serine/threonine protein kinase
MAISLGTLALVAARQGHDGQAEALFDEAITHARESDYRAGHAWILADRGWAAVWRGEHRRAEALLAESLGILRELGDRFTTAGCLEGLAAVACRQDRPERATHLLSAAAAQREVLGAPAFPLQGATRDQTLAEVRLALGETRFAEAWAVGGILSLDAAIEMALGAAADEVQSTLSSTTVSGLTG